MVILMVSTVNRIYSYIKIFCLQNHNAFYIYITEKGYPQPWLSAIHTPWFSNTLPKQNEIFCLVNLLLMGGFFGCAGFNVAASD